MELHKVSLEFDICFSLPRFFSSNTDYNRNWFFFLDNHLISLANITVHYIFQPMADIVEET